MPVASGKTLTARVRMDTSQAMSALRSLEHRINAVNNAVNRNVRANNQLNTSINRSVNTANRLNRANVQAANSAERINRSYQRTGNTIDGLTKKIKQLATAYMGVMGARAVITSGDVITSAENKLNNLPSGTQQSTQMSMDKMYVSAQNSRMGYADMMTNVSKSITLAGDAFQNNIDNAIRFQEIMAKAYTVGGASAAEQHSSMYQMIQALGSGILQGDELRSIREGAPIAYKEIEKFAQGVYNTEESLKKLASQGKITSDMVVAAVMQAGDAIDAKFENTNMTFAQAFTNMKNVALKSFEPVLQTLNKALNSDAGQKLIAGIGYALQFVAGVVNIVFQLLGALFTWFIENWYWLQYIVYAVLIAVTIHLAMMAGQAIATGITMFVSMLMGLSPLYLWIIVIGLVIAALVWLTGSFEAACGLIVGIVMSAVAFIWNLIVGVINGIIQFLWMAFVEPFITIIEFVLNCCMGGFDSFGDAVANLVGNIISWFLSLGTVVTKIIDAIFGTDWTGGLNALRDQVIAWGKNENAITISREAPTLQSVSGGTIDRWAYTDAYNTGYDWGSSAGGWVTDTLGSAGDWLSDKLNIGNLPNTSLTGSGQPYNVTDAYNAPTADDLLKGVKDTADNTGKIADSMELTQEDLEYLRKVAEMEWKKEFTTAEIHVDMSNYNNINSDTDLDGIVTKLTDKLYEELQSVADGVYV